MSISDLNSDAKHWQFVFENTGKLAKVNKNVGGLETEVAKLASNVQEMDSEQRAMNNAVAQLKIDSAENKKVVTTLNSDFPQLKVSPSCLWKWLLKLQDFLVRLVYKQQCQVWVIWNIHIVKWS